MRAPTFIRKVVPLALGATVITGTGLAWAHTGNGGAAYRTATVELGDVTQVVSATGTVSGLDTGSAAFGVSGIVDEVEVEPGDIVEAGDVLARMDTATLDAAVTAAEATLAKAKADLEDAENALADAQEAADEGEEAAETEEDPEESDPGSGSQPGGGQRGGGSTPTPTPEVDLTAPTQALNAARTAATVALDAAAAALASQQAACADVLTPPDDTEEAPTDQTAALRQCSDALAAVATAQQQVATAQAAVTAAETAYRAAMDQALAAAKARAEASEEATKLAQAAADAAKKQLTALQQNSGQTPSPRGGTSGGSTVTDLTAKVTVEEAAVRVAEVELEAAEEDLDAAVLRAPIGGKVAEVPFTEGDTASPDEAISILGDGAMQVELAVPAATARTLKKGMSAAVTSDGAEQPSEATVTAIGILPSTSTGATTYPVMISVPAPSKGLTEGAAAAVTITLRSVDDVVTVPNSAISSTGSGSIGSVTLHQDGKAVRQMVTIGAVGNTTTEITEGLTVGQVVVLADPSTEVPTSSTTSNRTGGFGPAGVTFGGGNIISGGGFSGGTGARRGG